MAAPHLGGSVNLRNRFTLSEALSIFSVESKVKPSLSSLRRPFFGTGLRVRQRLVLFLGVVVLCAPLVFIYSYSGVKSFPTLKRPAFRIGSHRNGPSLHDYPEVYVANSEPFEHSASVDVVSDQRALTKQSNRFAGGAKTPTLSESLVPNGLVATSEPSTRLIVLTMDRRDSLKRLLASLQRAQYDGDRVDLDVWIDRRSTSKEDDATMEQMVSAVRDCKWLHGVRTIHQRMENAGLYEQWIYSWNVTESSTEAALILEDDLEVSEQFYRWLKRARQHYVSDPAVGAFTLQRGELRPRQIRGVASGKLRISEVDHPVYKYRLLGTWGFAPEKKAWLEFREWYEEMREIGAKPYVDHLMTTDWYKSQEKGRSVATTMWSQWWIKFADVKGYFTVFANPPGGSTLASNYREGGMHYSDKPRSADFPVFKGSVSDLRFPESPVYLDWDGREIAVGDSSVKFRRAP